MDFNHCQIVRETLTGQRAVDEQSFASVAVLAERLERLKRLGENFGSVGLSDDVEELAKRKSAVAV